MNTIDSNEGDGAREKLIEIIQYDIEIRKLVVSTAGLDAEMLDFLLGRPLKQTLKNYGLTVLQRAEKIVLVQP